MGRNETLARSTGLASQDLAPWLRMPMMILGFGSLLLGLLAGEARLGWHIPLPRPGLILLHGPLMVSGFLGTLIGLERSVAVGQRVVYLGPAASAAGALFLIIGAPVSLGAAFFTAGALGLLVASFIAYRRQKALYTLTLLLGAGGWLVGNILWLTGSEIPSVVPWWAAFLILTIAGERLELSRLLRLSPFAHRLFAVLLVLILASLAAIPLQPHLARDAFALLLLALTGWLVHNDIARRTVRGKGLTRFMAVCLLSGYAWLGVAAIIGLFFDGIFLGSAYDATLHAVFLGFVFSMVFGHAPVILPAVTRLALPFHPLFYVHWALLELSLALRVLALPADLPGIRPWAAAINGIAILLFMANTIAAVIRGKPRGNVNAS